jgi:hypothetical protein
MSGFSAHTPIQQGLMNDHIAELAPIFYEKPQGLPTVKTDRPHKEGRQL